MNLSAEQLNESYEVLLKVIGAKITGDRKDQLLKLHEDWADRIAMAPASTKKSFHNAFIGGYVAHVLNVVKAVGIVNDSWKKMGAVLDYTPEEMYFAAICHDLGKIGTETDDYYIPCEEQWMIKKGQVYVLNPNLQYMKVPERSLMVLHSRGIKVSEKEYLAIKLHDGLYEDSNKSYFMTFNEDMELKTLLPHVIHQADLIACKIEGSRFK